MKPFRSPPLPANAAAVLFSEPESQARPPPLEASDPAPGSIAWEVFTVHRSRFSGRVMTLGLLVAVGLHAAVAAGALRTQASGQPTQASQPLVMFQYEVDVEPEPEPPKPTPPEPAPEPARPRIRRIARTPKPAPAPPPDAERPSGPPPPAQAGQVVAVDAEPAALDFTSFEITSGDAPAYAGGTTASSGTNSEAVHTRNVDPDSEGKSDLTRPVRLPARNWKCPWPEQAEPLGIDEQIVVLRAVVKANGEVASVEVLADPGYGFGQAAQACALHARFQSARDRTGATFAATSPPIRVRFTR